MACGIHAVSLSTVGENARGQKKKRDKAACGIHTALSIYAGKGGPWGYKWGSVWDSRCLVTTGMTQDEGVGRWGLSSCPCPLVIVKNPGERRNIHCSPCCGSPLLGCIPPASTYRLYGFWSPSLAIPLLPFGGVDGHWCGVCQWVLMWHMSASMGADMACVDRCWHGMCRQVLTWHMSASMGADMACVNGCG